MEEALERPLLTHDWAQERQEAFRANHSISEQAIEEHTQRILLKLQVKSIKKLSSDWITA